jgi:hypothetical protein
VFGQHPEWNVFYRPITEADGPLEHRGEAQGVCNVMRVSRLAEPGQRMRWAVHLKLDLTQSCWIYEQ